MNEELIAQIVETLMKREELTNQLNTTGKARLTIPMAIGGWDYNVTVHFDRMNL